MSATVDTNILVYAANAETESYDVARELLTKVARGPELLYLFWPTVMGFLRVATNPAIFANPLPAAEAIAAVTDLLERPHVKAGGEIDGFWRVYQASAGADTRGNDVPDAHLVALMRQHGVSVIYTRDRDFRRYEGLDVRDPFG